MPAHPLLRTGESLENLVLEIAEALLQNIRKAGIRLFDPALRNAVSLEIPDGNQAVAQRFDSDLMPRKPKNSGVTLCVLAIE
jgi:hypothetical protein